MAITENAMAVLKQRYLIKDEQGKPAETVDGMFRRVAKAVASADAAFGGDVQDSENRFYDLMTNLDFLPNSPTLMNAGRPLGQLSACFVLPVGDSMEEIFDAVKNAAMIHKSGGGTGFAFSRLRPAGSAVNSTGGVASGPVSFMKVFNAATEAVKQGGTRRGANMGVLRVDHPDILSFIRCKNDTSQINNFNISVGLTEKFMQAAEENRPYDLINPLNGQVAGQLNARQVFNTVVDSAWRTGEPGILFLDRLNRDNVVPEQGEIESTNPCGEQPLLPYESCNLGSVNLANHLKQENGRWVVDYDKLGRTVSDAVHFLDNVIEINRYPLEEIAKTTLATRKIGLGVMGFADALLTMGIAYNSEQGVQTGREIMAFVNRRGHEASRALARVRGPFPLFDQSIYRDGEPLRNATVTTIAPTGTLSLIAGVSSGVEPVFAYAYIRNIMDGTHLVETNGILREKLESLGLFSQSLMAEIAEKGTLAHVDSLPAEIRRIFVSAHDVSPQWHIRMQAAFQEYTDNAVSKTVNFPHDATREDVAQVYRLAWKLGCKGTTIYRDGSRDQQVLNIGKVSGTAPAYGSILPRPRPTVTSGYTEKVKIGCGNLYITVNYDEDGVCEVFTNTGKSGGCPSQSEATARLVSVGIRSGIDPQELINQLKGIRCPSTIRQPGLSVTSCPDAIAKTLEKVIKARQSGKAIPQLAGQEKKRQESGLCPECGAKLEQESGCVICRSCGYSKCG
ncbi:MAG TPA: vitamin B12-dependent ribonucleotide reductase [Candidatus Faecousia faecigallinarum]|nr:vitamin B12-dependent ribonucleotide reductase [Candidatus Faecousia faecigallinarum]